MNELIYWGVVLAGAVTLLIEANRNFRESLADTPFEQHPILKGIAVEKLCTSGSRNLGFAFYALFYLALYILVLSSTEVFELLSKATQSSTQIGPTDGIDGAGGDPLGLVSAGYGRPIFVSAAIIALVSTSIVKPIENTIRSLSHRLAGIPRGVYAVMESLHAFPFLSVVDDMNLTRLDSMFQVEFLANRPQLGKAGHHTQQIRTLREALLTIDHLAPALTGKLREQYFPFQNLEALHKLSDTLEKQISELESLLRAPVGDAEDEFAKLFTFVMTTANDTIALFSVHFIRNNRAFKSADSSPILEKVRKKIGLDYQVELNSFGMSILISSFAAILFGVWVVWTWQSHNGATFRLAQADLVQQFKEEPAPDPAADPKTTAEYQLKAACHKLNKIQVETLLNISLGPQTDASQAGPAIDKNVAQACRGTWKRAVDIAGNQRRYETTLFAFKEIIPILFAIALAALPALAGREVRKDDNSWPVWKFRRIPFLRLISMCLLPAVLAIVGISFGAFLLRWIEAGFHMTESQMTSFFRTNAVYFVMHAGLGFIVALGVLVLSDQHDELCNEFTYGLGIAFGLVAVGYYSVIVLLSYPAGAYLPKPDSTAWWFTFHVREALRFGSAAFFFLLFYSVFVEMTEDPNANGKRRSWIMKKLRGEKDERQQGVAT
jgi:hypothetical protein